MISETRKNVNVSIAICLQRKPNVNNVIGF